MPQLSLGFRLKVVAFRIDAPRFHASEAASPSKHARKPPLRTVADAYDFREIYVSILLALILIFSPIRRIVLVLRALEDGPANL